MNGPDTAVHRERKQKPFWMDINRGEALMRCLNCFCGKKSLSFKESTVFWLIFNMFAIKYLFWIDLFLEFTQDIL